MRALAVTLGIVLATALVDAQQHRPAPPPPKPPASVPQQPFKPSGPPTVFPFPPLPPQPTGGFSTGFMFPPQTHPAYSPRRSYPPYGYGGYAGGYSYAPDTQAPSAAPAAAEPVGMLRLSGTPSAAQVYVDGYFVGTIEDIESQRVLTLPAGPHRIELRAAGYTTSTFDVRITANEIVTYRAALETVRPQPVARPAAPAAGAAKMYLIPNCYLGNVPPKAERLPKGCDVKRVQVIS
jgi:PEGA domain-containing protein